jgi:hypothetical protein
MFLFFYLPKKISNRIMFDMDRGGCGRCGELSVNFKKQLWKAREMLLKNLDIPGIRVGCPMISYSPKNFMLLILSVHCRK